MPRPPEPCVVYPLPPAPHFVGREAELATLRACWGEAPKGVVALVGFGGAGKTAVASRFVHELLERDLEPRPRSLFVWSFYQEPDAGLFLQRLHEYLAGPGAASTFAKGAGLLHLLGELLSQNGPHLIVLDGLERVQLQDDACAGRFGQVEDPLLRGLLVRLAEGIGTTAALVTSRFPISDLDPYRDHGYRHIEIEGLDRPAALALLRRRGVSGDDVAVGKLIEMYGAHALTLDHLGGLIGQFLGGDPLRAPELPALDAPGPDRQALRLARLLRAYEEHLPEAELTLLSRLCLLPRSIKNDQIISIFLCTPPVQIRTARSIGSRLCQHEDLISRMMSRGPKSKAWSEWLDDLINAMVTSAAEGSMNVPSTSLPGAICQTIIDVLCDGPIAGPDRGFAESVLAALIAELKAYDSIAEDDIEHLIRLYREGTTAVPDLKRPIPLEDRGRLRHAIEHFQELRDHPLLPFKKPNAALEASFLEHHWVQPHTAELGPGDILIAYRREHDILRKFTLKHKILAKVRELGLVHQRRWRLAGALARLDAPALLQVVRNLVDRHLLLREADGSVSVHPAVRDYFSRRGASEEQGGWHAIVGQQLVNLVQRPGMRLPEDKPTLDLVEDAIHHILAAGRPDQALVLYNQVLGGHRHLAWKLGESGRGLRILRGFSVCPERWALGWYLRSLGELELAYEANNMAYFRADIRLLQGKLAMVSAEGDFYRVGVAAALRGEAKIPRDDPLGIAVPRAQLLLHAGRLQEARNALEGANLYGALGWEGDRARCRLLLADVARHMSEPRVARSALEEAAPWVLHSGSVEHLCLYHLVRARMARDGGDPVAARRAVDEGLRFARQSGLGLYQIELLCVQAETSLAVENAGAAEQAARRAIDLAAARDCGFLWGLAEALHLLGQSLITQRRPADARPVLLDALALRHRVGDPRAIGQTETLLSLVP